MNEYPITMISNLIKTYEKRIATRKNNNNTTEINTITLKKYKELTYSPHLSEDLRTLFITNDAEIEIGYKPYTTVNMIINLLNQRTNYYINLIDTESFILLTVMTKTVLILDKQNKN